MKLKLLGHSSFLITSEQGIRILTDPYNVSASINYDPIDESADIVTISHNHSDHNNEKVVKGNPQVIKQEGIWKIRGIDFKGISSFHDSVNGGKRGHNVIFCFTVDGINICHLGDLGHLLDENHRKNISPVDILLIPVGGYYTVDAVEATAIADSLNARIIIPMHFKTSKSGLSIASEDEFLKEKENVRRLSSSEIEFKKSDLPDKTEIIVLQHAL